MKICKQPMHKPYTDGNVTYKDKQITCNAPATKREWNAFRCYNCGSMVPGKHTSVDCRPSMEVKTRLIGLFCDNGHAQPVT